MKCLFTCAAILFLIVCNPVFSQKFDKYVDKYNTYYEKGALEKAYKINEKLKKQSIKKLGADNKYLPYVYLNEAELQLYSQVIVGVDELLNNSILLSTKLSGKESTEYEQILKKSIALYAGLGNYHKVEQIFSELDSALSFDKLTSSSQLQLIEVYLKQGFHNKSLELISNNLNEFRARATDSPGKKDEKERWKYEYATILNFAAENYLLRGELQKADSILNSNDDWFNKNLNKKDRESVYQEILFAFLYDARNDRKQAQSNFEKAYRHSASGRKDFDPFVLKIQEQLILAYIRYDRKGRLREEQEHFKNLIKKNYNKKSFLNQVLLNVEMEQVIAQNGSPKRIQSMATKIANDVVSLPPNHELKIKAKQKLYELELFSNNYPVALINLKSLNGIINNLYGATSPKYHIVQLQLANFYIEHTNNLLLADTIYRKSWDHVVKNEIAPEHEDYISLKNEQARYYEIFDQFDLASKTLDEATVVTMQRYDRNDVNFAVQLNKIASLQINLGEYKKAERYLELAMAVFDDNKIRGENIFYYSNALITEARLFIAKGMFDEADKNLRKAERSVSKNDKILIEKSNAAGVIADIYFQVGKYSKSESLINNELTRIKTIYTPDTKKLIPLFITLGELKLEQGDYTEAEQLARKALSFSNTIYGQNSSQSIPAMMLLSKISSSFGDFENSLTQLEKSKTLLIEKLGIEHIWMSEIYSRIGTNMLSESDDPLEIEALFNNAKDIVIDKLDDQSPLYADLLKKLAYVKIAQEDYAVAFGYLLEAEAIWIAKAGRRNNINASEIYVLLGDIYYMLKNFMQAEEYYMKAGKLYAKYFSENHPEYVKVLAKLSRTEYMMGNEKEALDLIEEVTDNYGNFIKYFFPTLSEREKAKFWNIMREDFEYYNTIVLNQIDAPNDEIVGKLYNNALNTKAILLNSSIKMRQNILNSGDTILVDQYENWLISKEMLSEALSMSVDQLAENGINLDSLTTATELLEKQLGAQSDIFSTSASQLLITWENIKSVLKKNEVAVEMMKYRHFDHVFTDSVIYMALIIKNDKKSDRPEVIVVRNGRELENKYFKYYKNMIMYKMDDTYSYANFWKPIEEKVGRNATIYFSPDGVYTQMNLEAISLGEGKYVMDNSNITLVSNTKDLYLKSLKKDKRPSENKALIFGDPEFYVSTDPQPQQGRSIIQSLPGTEKEVKTLSQLLRDNGWETDSFIHQEASEEEVKRLQNPRVFHIATHGFYTPETTIDQNIEMANINNADAMKNPLLRSGLMLKGAGDLLSKTTFNYNIESGILTAYEAMNLNLDYTDLVVLSACETGVGDISAGEGVYGLQRAFLVAGAKTLIMSMFKVSDEATNELMVNFYTKWMSTGEMRLSFVEAKKELRNKYPEPIYWGAFVMFGLE